MNDGIGFGERNDDFFIETENNTIKDSMLCFRCTVCGTMIKTKDSIIKCPFCGSAVEIADSLYFPEQIISFSKTLDDAKKDYKKHVLFNPLIPFSFKKKSTINSMFSVFLPVSLNDVNISGEVSFLGANKTDKGQKLSMIEKHELFYTVNFDYNNVFINCFPKIDDIFLNKVYSYNLNNLHDFDENELNKENIFLGEIDNDKINEKANKKVINHALIIIRDNINYGLKKLNKNSMIINNKSSKIIYVPVYMLNVKYKNKFYLYLMNGENGKYNMKLTIGIFETIIFSIIAFCLIFLLAFLLTYLF